VVVFYLAYNPAPTLTRFLPWHLTCNVHHPQCRGRGADCRLDLIYWCGFSHFIVTHVTSWYRLLHLLSSPGPQTDRNARWFCLQISLLNPGGVSNLHCVEVICYFLAKWNLIDMADGIIMLAYLSWQGRNIAFHCVSFNLIRISLPRWLAVSLPGKNCIAQKVKSNLYWNVCVCVCARMYICMYVCTCICICMCVYMHVCMYVCVCVCVCVCMYVCMYICMYV